MFKILPASPCPAVEKHVEVVDPEFGDVDLDVALLVKVEVALQKLGYVEANAEDDNRDQIHVEPALGRRHRVGAAQHVAGDPGGQEIGEHSIASSRQIKI